MARILGIDYITDKEAALRYGRSQSWFKQRRKDKQPPHYIKIEGKVYYQLERTDNWFKSLIRNF